MIDHHMITIQAKTKYNEFTRVGGYLKVAVAVLLGSGLSLLSYFFFENLLSLLTLLASSILILLMIVLPPQDLQVSLNVDGIYFDHHLLPWSDCYAWMMLDLNDALEFIIQTTDLQSTHYYFYVSNQQANLREFITYLSQILPYDEKIEQKNHLHRLIRFLGLN